MQYTSKLAILAVALFSTSVVAVPFASFDGDSELEVREADNELSAREFYEAYLEARADPSLDARDIEAMDFEAREYLEYLEAREAATVCLYSYLICCLADSFTGCSRALRSQLSHPRF